MKDESFQKLINRTQAAYHKYDTLKCKAEKEYERRMGYSPSDIDDDFWIDTIHYGHGSTDLKEILEAMEYSKQMADKKKQTNGENQ